MAKVLVFGTSGAFTAIVVQHLLSAGVPVAALALRGGARVRPVPPPAGRRPAAPIPVAPAGPLSGIAAAHRLPVVALDEADEEQARETIRRGAADVGVIACFPRILSASWLALTPRGAFNLHPSRLPAYRGPSPLFWQFRNGERRMGVTLHRASAAPDAGPLVAADEVAVAAGAAAAEVGAALARRGAALLVDALARLDAGTLAERAQDERCARWFGPPDDDAFRVPCSWPAERAFRFMRGVREWGRAFPVETGDASLVVVERALDFESTGGREGTLRREGRVLRIGFARGTLRAVESRAAAHPADAGGAPPAPS